MLQNRYYILQQAHFIVRIFDVYIKVIYCPPTPRLSGLSEAKIQIFSQQSIKFLLSGALHVTY